MGSGAERRARWMRVARVAVYLGAALTLSAGLSRPFLGMHSWRQTQNAMVARNFARDTLDPTVTQLDLGGGGLVYGVNLPVLCWPTGVAWRLVGDEPAAVPRVLALLATLLAAWLLERLGRRLAGPGAGLLAAVLFLQSPLIAGYGASFLEDAVMLAFLGLAIERAHAWGERPRWRDALLAGLGVALTVGIKLPVGAAVVPATAAAALLGARGSRGWRALFHPQLLAALTAGIVLGVSYYAALYWRSTTVDHFAWAFTFEPGTDKWASAAMLTDPETSVLLFKRVTQEVCGFAGLGLVLLALGASIRDPRIALPLAWLAAVVAYMFVSLGGQLAHDYYQLPLVQPLALLGAFAFAATADGTPRPRWRSGVAIAGTVLVLVMCLELNPFRRFLRGWEDPRWSELASAVASTTSPDELVLAIDHQRPEVLYYADRRGYHLHPREVTAASVAARIEGGVTAVAVLEPQRLDALWTPQMAPVLDGWTAVSSGPHHLVLRREAADAAPEDVR